MSAAFIAVGVHQWQKGRFLIANGKKADAVVFRNNRHRDTWYPVVRFLTDRQEWITQELDIGHPSAIPEGTKLQVVYDPDNPADVAINSQRHLEILPLVFVAIGVILFVFGTLEMLGFINLVG